MVVNEILQIIVILTHIFVLYKRFRDKSNLITFKHWYGAILQCVLIFIFIRQMSIYDLQFKQWYWFVFDIALAIYFGLRVKQNKDERQ